MCENKEVRQVDREEFEDSFVQVEKVCFLLLSSKEKDEQNEVLKKVLYDTKNSLISHSIDLIEDKSKEESPYNLYGHI